MGGPIAPVSAQRMPIQPVGQSEEKIPISPIGEHPEQTPKVTTKDKLAALQSHLQGGSAVNSVQEEEKKGLREPPIGDVMKENEPPIGTWVLRWVGRAWTTRGWRRGRRWH